MPNIFILLFPFTLLCGCVNHSTPPPIANPQFQPYHLSKSEIKVVKNGVKSNLKDPVSASFPHNIEASKASNGNVFTCGYVNAKNSFGGYVGNMIFAGRIENGEYVSEGIQSGARYRQLYLDICSSKGINF